jgi:hypothetical protein
MDDNQQTKHSAVLFTLTFESISFSAFAVTYGDVLEIFSMSCDPSDGSLTGERNPIASQ